MEKKKIKWKQRWNKLELFSDKNIKNKFEISPINEREVSTKVYFYPLSFYIESTKDIKGAVKAFQEAVKKACAFAYIEKGNNHHNYPIVFVKNVGHENFWNGSVRCIDFIKSSTWNYYWDPMDENAEIEIERILSDIQKNYEEGRYDLTVAKEYAEFNYRQCLNSYLEFDDHSAAVSPFVFHSEREMNSRLYNIDEDSGSKNENLSHNLNWRLLLVDDHPNEQKPMMATNGLRVGKLDIIRNDLNRIGIYNLFQNFEAEKSKENNDFFIEFDFARTVDGAYEKIKNNKYDIILLDYKLDKDEKGRQEYGYELLERIRDDQEGENAKKELKPGPNETFYFMFISAYTTAVQERLQAEGFYVSKDYWFIGRGACPTNTPYLFLYSLKRMMDIRYDKLTKHSKQLLKDLAKGSGNINDKKIDEEKGKYATMTMFLTKLYEKDNERNNCVLGFNAFLNLRRVYDTIKHDVNHDETLGEEDRRMKSSPLIMSLFKDEKYCSNSFWEHLQNLVYLTAFGTIRQWPEMWEDYMFIKTKLEKAEDEIWKVLSEDEKKNNAKPSFLIRNYILNLKGMMS